MTDSHQCAGNIFDLELCIMKTNQKTKRSVENATWSLYILCAKSLKAVGHDGGKELDASQP